METKGNNTICVLFCFVLHRLELKMADRIEVGLFNVS